MDDVREGHGEAAEAVNIMTTDQYIDAVTSYLPQATPRRAQIGIELRGHIAERVANGTPLDEVLRQLGDPRALAESYLAEVPLTAAPHGRRILAKIVDVVLIIGMFVALALPAGLTALKAGEQWVPIALIVATMASGILAGLYTVVLEWRYGYTVGKYLTGLLVVRESGARISFGQSVVRQLPVCLQVGWVDALFALFTDKRQRAFELLSKTRVVAAGQAESEQPALAGEH
jgi:uncharacterized RDD family membrane protein YckC